MEEVKNVFIKSKMNKDLDSRLIPSGEYRNASNIQVSRSEGADVGALESVLGNIRIEDFSAITGINDISCIGFLTDDSSSILYLFFTNYSEVNLINPSYDPLSKNFIFSYNTLSDVATLLVEGSFLNFSKTNPIYGVNLLENLLFWTDNRNQPRKINVVSANNNNLSNPTYYTNEDHLSVAKYNPFAPIQTYQPSIVAGSTVGDYESTLKDVTSLYYPNGGAGTIVSSTSTAAVISSVKGELVVTADNYNTGASVSYIDTSTGYVVDIDGVTLDTAIYDTVNSNWDITVLGGSLPSLTPGQRLVFNSNTYYNPRFTGDSSFLEDKFVRFAYRFKFDDGENSLFSTFTQASFIPKQDGYFMYTDKDNLDKISDESSAFRSSVVTFVENKVNQLDLRVPLPFVNYNISQALKITGIDILYKESDGLSVKVVDTVSISDIENSSGVFTTGSSSTASKEVFFTNLQGGVKIDEIVTGTGITGNPTVVSFEYDENSTTSGVITLSDIQTISSGVELTIGDPNFLTYTYNSKKPYKTLPSNDITRVYDKVPVRALSQEIISNRVVYGNFQDKHTPPPNIDYNVLVSEKSEFNLNIGSAVVSSVDSSDSITIASASGTINGGSRVIAPGIPLGTYITEKTGSVITLSNDVTLSVSDALIFEPASKAINTTSSVSHPSSSLKTNRTYQVGIVLSDRYGRQSTTILSNNSSYLEINGNSFSGSTLFSSYIDNSVNPIDWLGNSIKLSINKVIGTTKNFTSGEPGIYNGVISSADYNPTGWYSLKVVVKQNEQEYYNVYLPGIMASYPTDSTLELGSTSHIALISDNINKVPRDLTEIGPDQKLYRSSVQLFGRVQNSSETITLNTGEGSMQYFPGTATDTATSIADMNTLFDYDNQEPPSPNLFPQFYSFASNPLIAKISTNAKIGQIATTNFFTFSGTISSTITSDLIKIVGVSGDTSNIQIGDNVTGPGLPEGLKVDSGGFTPEPATGTLITARANTSTNIIELSTTSLLSIGDSLSGTGVPEVTFVLDIVLNAGAPMTVTLNQNVSVTSGTQLYYKAPATIDTTSSVSMTAGNSVTVSSFARPGIQELAIYETEPVVSSLDIFWETSTVGLVADINQSILTTSSSGIAAAGINSYNTAPFTEALWPTQATPPVYPAILTAPIYLVDAFGQQIPVSQINIPLTIASVISNSINVQTSGAYFQLIETAAGSGEYNIVTTQAYMDNVYFNVVGALNVFMFNFTATVNGQQASFSETITLGNQNPIILSSATEASPHTGIISTDFIQPTIQNIITLVGYNGSAGTIVDASNPPSNRSQDLTWSKESEFRSDGTTVSNYFAINSSTGAITNTGYQNTNMPADNYTVTIKLSDPSLSVERKVKINMGLEVHSFQIQTVTATTSQASGRNPFTKTWFRMFIEARNTSIVGAATVETIGSNTITVSNVSGTIQPNQLAVLQNATAKVDGAVFNYAIPLKQINGPLAVGNTVAGGGVVTGSVITAINGNTITTNNLQTLDDDAEIFIEKRFVNMVTSFANNTVTFNNFQGSLGLAVGDEVLFETISVDLAAGWYYYVDTTNPSQTEPWTHMIENSGAPQDGGVIQIPCGGVSVGRASCDTWKKYNDSQFGSAYSEFAATCLPSFSASDPYDLDTYYTFEPTAPVNFTFEYVDGYYLVAGGINPNP
tara:strand:- start:1500 stop:6509 length:5010 start_codon:yes stop_codon:yes gene_type:complete